MPYPMTVIEFTPENIRLISGYVKEEKIYLTNALEGEDLTIEGKLPALREASESLKCLKEKALESIKDLGSVILVLPPFDFEVLSNIDGQEYPSNSDGNLTSSDYQNCFNRILNREIALRKARSSTSIPSPSPSTLQNDLKIIQPSYELRAFR